VTTSPISSCRFGCRAEAPGRGRGSDSTEAEAIGAAGKARSPSIVGVASDASGRADRRLIVGSVSLRNFRSYERLELELQPGLVLAVGPNGVGKTNLLEAIHVATQGFSPRTRTDAQLVRFGDDGVAARRYPTE
jgi:ATPase subunit of ABC transporter with duplicated ATPase domains